MTCFSWPSNPTIGQEVTVGNVTYKWTGMVWDSVTAPLKLSQITEDGGFDDIYSRNFKTVADMKAANLEPNITVRTLGFHSSGDGGGSEYAILLPAQATADGYLVHQLNNGNVAAIQLGGSINVRQTGCVGSGVVDDTLPFQAATDSGRKVIVPKGNYAINVDLRQKIVMVGEGCLNSRLTPFDTTKSALNYTYAAQVSRALATGVVYFDYHSEIRDIGFYQGSKQGIGFSFGKALLTDFETNDNFANNVKFYGCHFDGLDKGVQFSFGNIGTEFYSCGFKENYYGVYSLNNKFSASLMHAGNKHFYGGEFNSNTCAVYIHNGDAAGYGDFVFHDTILEANLLVAYVYNNSAIPAKPTIQFEGVWLEANALHAPPAVASPQVAVDSWVGSVKGTIIFDVANMVFDGDGLFVTFDKCGGVGNLHLKAPNSTIHISKSFVSEDFGNGGGANLVSYPETSYIREDLCIGTDTSSSGQSIGTYTLGETQRRMLPVDSNSARAIARWSKKPLFNKAISATPNSLKASNSGVTAMSLGGGSFALAGTVVSDGVAHNQCTEFTRASFSSGELARVIGPVDTSVTLQAGYHVLTFSVKLITGSLNFLWWDRGANSAALDIDPTGETGWVTYAASIHTSAPTTIYLDCRGKNENVTWRMADIQIHSFDSVRDVREFISDKSFYG